MLQPVVAVILLVLVYASVLSSRNPADLATGLVIAIALAVHFRRFVFPGQSRPLADLPRRAAAAVPLAVAVLRQVLAGSWQVARVVLSRRGPMQPGLIVVTLEEAEPNGLDVCALLLTLSPGSLAVDVDPDKRTIHLHVLDATDPDAVRREFTRFYRVHQRAVFP